MRLAVLLLSLLLAGCLPDPQPHHQPLDPALLQTVRAALASTLAAIDAPELPARQLDWQASLLANFARNATPAYQALQDGRLGDAELQDFGRAMVARLAERQGPEAQPPAVLAALLAAEPPLDQGQRLLLLGSINRLVGEGHLRLSDVELRFLGRPVPQRPPGPVD